MRSKELRDSRRLAVALALLGGGAVAWMVSRLAGPAAGAGDVVGAFFVGGGAFALPALLYGILLDRVADAQRQQRALVNLRPLYGPRPLRFGDYALDASTAELLVRLLFEKRPRLVVECGAGTSTVLVAACLRELGGGRLVSLEHDGFFAERTRRELRDRGLERWAEIVTAPLEEHAVAGATVPWYGGFEAHLSPEIDVLFVDGPPSRTARRARYPAVPLLRPYLAPECVVVLDDGRRWAERRIAWRWAGELPGSAEYFVGGMGAWVLRRWGEAAERSRAEARELEVTARAPAKPPRDGPADRAGSGERADSGARSTSPEGSHP